MSGTEIVLLFLCMMLVTYIPRALPAVWLDRLHFGPRVEKFLNLIRDNNFAEAMRIARQQIENGARIIDVNMDDSLLDSKAVMCQFLLTAAAEPEIARTPVMIDSSRWEVIEAALQCVQGKCVVNSISLKEGEAPFLEKARRLVAQAADRTARQRGKFRVVRDLLAADDAAERVQGVALERQRAAFAVHFQVGHAVLDREEPVRVHAQERIPSEVFAALHAFQQRDVVVLHESFQHGHRRVHVARNLAADRHDFALLGQCPEFVQRCFFHGFSCCFLFVF